MKKLLTLLLLLTTLVFSSCAFPFTQQESSESASSSEISSESLEESVSSEISSLEEPEEEIKVFDAVGKYGRYGFEGVEIIGLDFNVPDELNLDNTRGWIGGDTVRVWFKNGGWETQEFIYYKKLEDGSLELVFGRTLSTAEIIKWEYIPAEIMRIKYYKATDTEPAHFVQLDENDAETPVRIGKCMNPLYYITDFDTEPMDGRGIVEQYWEDGQILYASYSAVKGCTEQYGYLVEGYYDKNPRP